MPRSPKGRFWCFTINNPTDADTPVVHPSMGYLIYQLEVGAQNGTPHWQGYFECHKQVTQYAITKWPGFSRASLRLRCKNATAEDNLIYCHDPLKRAPNAPEPFTYGIPSRIGVTRTYDEIVQAVSDGASPDDLIENHLAEYIKHKHAVDAIIRSKRQCRKEDIAVPPIVLSRWQANIITIISGEPDPRKVHWYYDTEGGKGKSTFTKYLIKNFNAVMIDTTKKERVVRAYDNEPVVVFDITRQEGMEQSINYSIMETMKNGYGFNTMYEPGLKVWHVPHVIVFSNFMPDCSKLSADRWDITQL